MLAGLPGLRRRGSRAGRQGRLCYGEKGSTRAVVGRLFRKHVSVGLALSLTRRLFLFVSLVLPLMSSFSLILSLHQSCSAQLPPSRPQLPPSSSLPPPSLFRSVSPSLATIIFFHLRKESQCISGYSIVNDPLSPIRTPKYVSTHSLRARPTMPPPIPPARAACRTHTQLRRDRLCSVRVFGRVCVGALFFTKTFPFLAFTPTTQPFHLSAIPLPLPRPLPLSHHPCVSSLFHRACSTVVIALQLVSKVLGSNPVFSTKHVT